jgi:phospholipid/cholesterol/gamma-HCH transport system substrate-binding protein
MEERVIQFRIGLMVLVTLIITVFLLMLFGGQQKPLKWFERKQVFYVQFREAPGVIEDTPVQKSGIRIGRVREVRLADEITDRELPPDVGAVVTIEIDQERRIFTDEVCRIKRNLLGDAVLEFVRAGPKPDPQDRGAPDPSSSTGSPEIPAEDPPRKAVEPGTWLVGRVQTDPIQLVGNLEADVSNAIQSIAETSDEIRDFVDKINEFFGTREELEPRRERLDKIMEKTLATMEQMETLTQHANEVIGDEDVKRQLKDAVDEVPEVLHDVRGTLDRVRGTLDGMDETVRLVNKNLQNIEGFTEPLGERGGVVVDRLDRGAQKLELLLDELHAFSRALNSREGSFGRLVHDPELYDNLNQAVADVDDLIGQMRPVVWNARVFSDKIARHPGVVVRDAIRPGPGTKGVPQFPELEGAPRSPQPYSVPRVLAPR